MFANNKQGAPDEVDAADRRKRTVLPLPLHLAAYIVDSSEYDEVFIDRPGRVREAQADGG